MKGCCAARTDSRVQWVGQRVIKTKKAMERGKKDYFKKKKKTQRVK